MMKSKYVLILAAIAAVLMIGLVAAVSVNSTAKAGGSSQQGISTNACPFVSSAVQQVSDGCCKSKCNLSCAKDCCKKKCDPNCTKDCCKNKCDHNCTK